MRRHLKKWNQAARKKGNVILMSLMSMIIIVVLAGVFINLFIVYETLNRGISVVEEAARVRAQAIDVPLKEYKGFIEVIHPNYGYMDHDNVDHELVDQEFKKTGAAGHMKPQNPTSELYQNASYAADEAAKEAALRLLDETVGVNAENNPLIVMTKDDFCFDIQPLPAVSQDVTFSCKTQNGASIKNTVYISSIEENSYQNMEKPEDSISVRNVVFVGASFKYNYFIYGALVDLGWNVGAVKETYAIAYPQVNKCTPIGANQCP